MPPPGAFEPTPSRPRPPDRSRPPRLVGPALLVVAATIGCVDPGHDRGVPDDGLAHELLFAITAIRAPAAAADPAVGVDLDGVASDPARSPVRTCEDLALDGVSAREEGVDDAANVVMPILDELAGSTMDARLEDAIARGKLSLGIRIAGVRAAEDGAVEVAVVTLPAQREIAIARGTISGSTVRARFDALALPAASGLVGFLPLDALGAAELVLDLEADEDGRAALVDAQLGTSAAVEDVLRDLDAIDPARAPLMRRVVEESADVEPSATDPLACRRLSIGLAVDARAVSR